MIKTCSILFLSICTSNILIANEYTNNYTMGISLDYQRIYSESPKFIDINSNQDNIGGLSLILGYRNLFDDYINNKKLSLNIEGRISKSFWEEDFAKSMRYSIFVKPQYNIYKSMNIYGLLGFGKLKIKGHNGHTPAHQNVIDKTIYNDTSFQWGIGINTNIYQHFSLFIDYTSLTNNAKIDSTLYFYNPKVYKKLSSDSVNIGLNYKFNLNH